MTAFIIAAALIAEVLLLIFLPAVGWSVVAFLALLILVLIIIPIGAHVSFISGEFSLSAKISCFELKLLPKKKKKPVKEPKAKPEKKKEKTETKTKAKEKKEFPFNFDELMALAKKAIKGLGKFGRLTVYKFMLHYLAAGDDPYKTAMTYGYINAALSSLAPVCRQSFNVKDDIDVWTDVDFTAEKAKIDAELTISLRLLQLIHVALVIVFGAVPVLIRNRRRLAKEKRAIAKENKSLPTDNNTGETKENSDIEERKDSDG